MAPFGSRALAQGKQEYDLLLKGGHVLDARNKISAVRDVAIKDGKIAAVAENIAAARALKTVDVTGLYVTPGLIDLHAHVYRPTVGQGFRADNSMVYPDGFSFRAGVTTFVDPGGSGWRNFEHMKDMVIDRSMTRVLAFINIVGRGSAGGKYEQDLTDMEVKPTADMARKHKGLIIGVKSAHYSGPEWAPFERAVEVGKIAEHPGDGGLRQRQGAKGRRAVLEGLPARGHLDPHVRRQPRRAGSHDARSQPGVHRGPQEGHSLRRRPWRRQLSVARGGPDDEGGVLARTRCRPTCTRAA